MAQGRPGALGLGRGRGDQAAWPASGLTEAWSWPRDSPVPSGWAVGVRVRQCGDRLAADLQSREPARPQPAVSSPSAQDWYVQLVKAQCWTRSDSALLEGAELVSRIPAGDLGAFVMHSVRGPGTRAWVAFVTARACSAPLPCGRLRCTPLTFVP